MARDEFSIAVADPLRLRNARIQIRGVRQLERFRFEGVAQLGCSARRRHGVCQSRHGRLRSRRDDANDLIGNHCEYIRILRQLLLFGLRRARREGVDHPELCSLPRGVRRHACEDRVLRGRKRR